MPLRFAMVLYPVSMLAWKLSRPSAIEEFDRVAAYSAATSRKPSSLGVPNKTAKKATAKGLLIAVGDGRFYLDRAAVRRAELVTTIGLIVGTLLFIPIMWLML